MLFLSVACDNLFMFKNFYLDFTYERKLNHFLAENDVIFPEANINVRKKMLLLGGNASGKTTFGVLLCAINNFIIGMPVTNNRINLFNAIFDANQNSCFEVEFVCKENAYRMKCVFNKERIIEESLKVVKIYKSYNIKKLRQRLDNVEPVAVYSYAKPSGLGLLLKENIAFVSNIMSKDSSQKMLELKNEIHNSMGFHYFFSNYSEQNSDSKITIPVDMINHILPAIDNSVEKVVTLQPSDTKIQTTSYLILFKNGEQVTIPEGDLASVSQDRLSHGTYEALAFLNILQEIKTRPDSTIYVDEKLPHLHAELEAYLVMKVLLMKHNGQIFFTTHNSELLDLNVPNNVFLLFKRGEDGYNSALFVSDKLSKNDRSVRNYYENDYFGVMPDYSVLDTYFEDIVS